MTLSASVTVLWATHESYSYPQMVRAWSSAYGESYGDEEDILAAKQWFELFGDERDWRFWTTTESIPVPTHTPVTEGLV